MVDKIMQHGIGIGIFGLLNSILGYILYFHHLGNNFEAIFIFKFMIYFGIFCLFVATIIFLFDYLSFNKKGTK